MNIPNLPTDNLYKFIALFGVVIFFFSIYYINYLLSETGDKLTLKETETGELEFEVSLQEEEMRELEKEVDKVNLGMSNYRHTDTIGLIIDGDKSVDKLESRSNSMLKFRQRINVKKEKIKAINNELRFKHLRLERKLKILKEKTKEYKRLVWSAVFGSGMGIFMMIQGFRLWYIKVQKLIDQKLMNEIVKSNNTLTDTNTKSA